MTAATTLERAAAPAAVPQLDATDTWLLDAVQRAIPIEPDPWSVLGRERRLSGDDVLARMRRLKAAGVIHQVSPIFDSAAIGYTSMLVAARVEEARIEEAAAVVSQLPGVSHNYRREAEYNLWFTLAVPPGEAIETHLAQLARDAGLLAVRPMPSLRTFHIGVHLAMGSDNGSAASKHRRRRDPDEATTPRADKPVALSDFDRRAIRATQDDLPLVDRPFEPACAELGISFGELQLWFATMKASGAMRRFAAILRHRSTGYVANGMGVWQLPPQAVEPAGKLAATFTEVSHCYERPSYDDWPYNLYTMIHARTRPECQATIDRLAAAFTPLGLLDKRVLYSTHEYKKQRVRYFV